MQRDLPYPYRVTILDQQLADFVGLAVKQTPYG
jgi:hypothetical protein